MNRYDSGTYENWLKENLTEEEIQGLDNRFAVTKFFINLRNKLNLSQKDVADMSGVKQPMIARIEKGKVNIGVNTLNKILMPLGYELTITKIKKD